MELLLTFAFLPVLNLPSWSPGYVVWAFNFWLWIMQRGIVIVDYDLLDYSLWAEQGVSGLRESISEKEFKYFTEHTKDIECYADSIKDVLAQDNFTFHRERPIFSDLIEAVCSRAACEVVLDSATLNRQSGFALHRVVVLGFRDGEVIFHDPWTEPRPNRAVRAEHFQRAWLEAVAEPELCIYHDYR